MRWMRKRVQSGWCGAAGAGWNMMCEKVVMAEKRKLEFDSLSGVSEAESADIRQSKRRV